MHVLFDLIYAQTEPQYDLSVMLYLVTEVRGLNCHLCESLCLNAWSLHLSIGKQILVAGNPHSCNFYRSSLTCAVTPGPTLKPRARRRTVSGQEIHGPYTPTWTVLTAKFSALCSSSSSRFAFILANPRHKVGEQKMCSDYRIYFIPNGVLHKTLCWRHRTRARRLNAPCNAITELTGLEMYIEQLRQCFLCSLLLAHSA